MNFICKSDFVLVLKYGAQNEALLEVVGAIL